MDLVGKNERKEKWNNSLKYDLNLFETGRKRNQEAKPLWAHLIWRPLDKSEVIALVLEAEVLEGKNKEWNKNQDILRSLKQEGWATLENALGFSKNFSHVKKFPCLHLGDSN